MIKSLALVSVLALGASAQLLPDVSAFPPSCYDACESVSSFAPNCDAGDGVCLKEMCGAAGGLKGCLECANMGSLWGQLVDACTKLGHSVGPSTGPAGAADGSGGIAVPGTPAVGSGGSRPASGSGDGTDVVLDGDDSPTWSGEADGSGGISIPGTPAVGSGGSRGPSGSGDGTDVILDGNSSSSEAVNGTTSGGNSSSGAVNGTNTGGGDKPAGGSATPAIALSASAVAAQSASASASGGPGVGSAAASSVSSSAASASAAPNRAGSPAYKTSASLGAVAVGALAAAVF